MHQPEAIPEDIRQVIAAYRRQLHALLPAATVYARIGREAYTSPTGQLYARLARMQPGVTIIVPHED